MSIENVKAYLNEKGIGDSYIEFPGSSATVTLAAEQLGCEPDRIAKSLAIKLKSGRLLVIVVSGESKLDNSKFKKLFKETSHFCPAELLPELFGHPMGGVCPFALKDNVEIFLDESLKKYDIVYPAAGAPNNAVKITPERLAEILSAGWGAVTKGFQIFEGAFLLAVFPLALQVNRLSCTILASCAGMAKLVDAPGLGPDAI